jgi:tetratricopeptide (TPR) repeat protein
METTINHRAKINSINDWRSEFKIDYGYIHFYDQYSEDLINQIYDLTINDKIDLTNTNPVYIRYLGYYYYLKDNIDEMKKYFQIGVDNGDSQSMVELGLCNLLIDKDLEKSKELLMLSVEKGNIHGMYRLAISYTDNMFKEDPEYCDKESDKLFDKLIELKFDYAMNYLGNFYLFKNPIKSREYFIMMNESGNISGNFGIIELGCNKETKKELLTEIITKWNLNRCVFKNMNKLISQLVINNVDANLLLKHCERLEFKNVDVIFKVQAVSAVLKNKMKFSKQGECPICLEEKELIPFDCFGHFFCVECDKKTNKCALCRISRNQLLYDE